MPSGAPNITRGFIAFWIALAATGGLLYAWERRAQRQKVGTRARKAGLGPNAECGPSPEPLESGNRRGVANTEVQEVTRTSIGTRYDLVFREPDIPERNKIRSVSGSRGDVYSVNLIEQKCTCPDYAETRATAARNSTARLCKHLMRELRYLGVFEDTSEWLKAIAESGCGGPRAAWLVHRKSSPPALVTVGTNPTWINI